MTSTSEHVRISRGGDAVRLAPETAEERDDDGNVTRTTVETTSAASSPNDTGRHDTGRHDIDECLGHGASSEPDPARGVVVSIGDVERVSVASTREASGRREARVVARPIDEARFTGP